MKTLIALLMIAVTLMLSGCWETTKMPPGPTVEETTRAGFLDKMFTQAAVPLFKLTCPVQGCVIGSMEVGNPFAVTQLADTVRVVFAPQRNEWLEFAGTLVNAVAKVGGYKVLGDAAAKISGNIVSGYTAGYASQAQIAGYGFDATGKVASFIPQPGANITQNIGGDGVIGSGSLTKTDRHDITPAPVVIIPPTKNCTTTTGSLNCPGG